MKIELRSKKYLGMYAEIDDGDYHKIKKYKWRVHKTSTKWKDKFYAVTDYYNKGKRTTISMHRLLMGLPPHPLVVDHIDNNGLNNKRSNLRLLSPKGNSANSDAPNRSFENKHITKYKESFWINCDKEFMALLRTISEKENIPMVKIVRNALNEHVKKEYSCYWKEYKLL